MNSKQRKRKRKSFFLITICDVGKRFQKPEDGAIAKLICYLAG